MTLKNRNTAVDNFKMFIQEYRLLVEKKVELDSLSKQPNDYFDEMAKQTERLIQTYENTLILLYKSALF